MWSYCTVLVQYVYGELEIHRGGKKYLSSKSMHSTSPVQWVLHYLLKKENDETVL